MSESTTEQSSREQERNPRAFIDMNGGYQTARTGVDKEAHDAWVESNTWGLSRDDFIRLSYFHGNLEDGDDGRPSEDHPINGSTFKPGDVVYMSESGGCLTRAMVSHWLADCGSFMHGFKKARAHAMSEKNQPVAQEAIGTFNCPICGNGTPHHHSDFEQVQAMSEEQIDAELRALGIDPDKAAQKVKAVIDHCWAEYDRRLKNPLAAPQPSQGAQPVVDQEPASMSDNGSCGSQVSGKPVSAEARMLRNLLARIHRDGGHYIAQHGLDKAVEDADLIVSDLLALQQVSAEADRYKRALEAIIANPGGASAKRIATLALGLDGTEQVSAEAGKGEPFGYWHEGPSEDESEFFLAKDLPSNDCPRCFPLYLAPSESVAVSAAPSALTAQAVGEKVTDEQIVATAREKQKRLAHWDYDDLVSFARAVLALAAPMPQPEPTSKGEAVADERQPSDGDYLRWAEQAGAEVNWDFESASSARVVFLTASQWGRFCDKVRALYLHPSQPEPASKGIAKMTQAEFIEWFGKNYYGEVVFGDPEWHAKSIYRRLVREQQ